MIVKNFKWFVGVIAVLVIAAVIVGIACGGMNLGIDFTGGTLVTVEIGEEYNSEELGAVVSDVDGIKGAVTVTKSGDANTTALIRIQSTEDEAELASTVASMMDAIHEVHPNAVEKGTEVVGGTASGDLIRSAVLSVVIASALMLVYIWIRFDLYSGIAAVAGLLSTIIAMVACMCIFRIQVDSTFIAACLTILGYAINNTVVLFDRVRENIAQYDPRKSTYAALLDTSIKETLSRTINTSITTLIPAL